MTPIPTDAIRRAASFLSEISVKRMNRIQANHELAHGAEHRALPRPAKVRYGTRVTPKGKRGGRAGKILRGQR